MRHTPHFSHTPLFRPLKAEKFSFFRKDNPFSHSSFTHTLWLEPVPEQIMRKECASCEV